MLRYYSDEESFHSRHRGNDNLTVRGCFTTLRTHHIRGRSESPCLFRFENHLNRLLLNAKALGISHPPRGEFVDGVKRALTECLSTGSATDWRLRLEISEFDAAILALPYQPAWSGPIKALLVNGARPLPEQKHLDTRLSAAARATAEQYGLNEAIFLSEAQYVLEGAWTNVIAKINNRWLSPKSHVLPGITRDALSSCIPLEMCDIHSEEILQAEELYVTQATTGTASVSELFRLKGDRLESIWQTRGDGRLVDIYQDLLQSEAEEL